MMKLFKRLIWTQEQIEYKDPNCDLCYPGNCPHVCHAKHMNDKEWFPITSLHRDDLKEIGIKNPETIDDETMELIANDIADALMESNLYWTALRESAAERSNRNI